MKILGITPIRSLHYFDKETQKFDYDKFLVALIIYESPDGEIIIKRVVFDVTTQQTKIKD